MSKLISARAAIAVAAGAGLIAAGSLVAAAPAFAATTITVTTGGNDATGAGTVASPYATIAKAVSVAAAGDTISLGAGDFAGATIDEDVTLVGTGASNITSVVNLVHGAEGATLDNLDFTADTTQIVVDGLTGTPVTKIEDSHFDLPELGTQSNSIQIGSGKGLQILRNVFEGDDAGTESVTVNIIGHPTQLINDIDIIGNTSRGYTNFVVAVGNGTAGISDVEISDNEAYDTEGSAAIYLSENLADFEITGNYLHDNNGGVRLTLYNGGLEPVYDAIGTGIDISSNFFANNTRALRVEAATIKADITATGNVFTGNTEYGVSNLASGYTVVATGGSWSTGTPNSSGVDSVTSGVTYLPIAAEPPFTEPADSTGAASNQIAGSSEETIDDETTVQLGAAHANSSFAVWGYSTKTFLGWVQTDEDGETVVTWPVSPLYGNHQLAFLTAEGELLGFVGVTGAAETPFTITPPTPGISGTPKVGNTLTAIPRTWDAGVVLSYQWKANGVDIVDADGTQLTLAPAQVGKKITLAVTGTKVSYPTTTKLSPASANVAAGTLVPVKPVVSGKHNVGSTLVADAGEWGPDDVDVDLSYRWQRDGFNITGATDDEYTQKDSDLGHVIRVKVTGTAAGYATLSVKSSTPSATKVKLVKLPTSITIPAVAKVGTKISITKIGTYGEGAVLSYSWKVAGRSVSGAKSSTFTPRAQDVGKTVRVTVSATKLNQTTSSITSNSSNLVIEGTFGPLTAPIVSGAQVGNVSKVVLASLTPTPTSYRYQWILGSTDIPGATKSTYTPTGAQQGGLLSVRITAVKAGFTEVSATSATKTIQVGGFSKTTKPTISGTAKVGKILTASATGWSPAAQFAYQWKLDGDAIIGAIDKTYTVSTEDLGGKLTVEVTGARAGFVSGVETSNPTKFVVP